MRLIRIDHIRCDDYSASTYARVPEEWSDEEFEKRLWQARREYLEAIELAKEKESPPNDWRYGKPPYEKYPDKTVKEVEEDWEMKKEEYAKWKERQRATKESFSSYLKREGFTLLTDIEEDDVFDLDWGHRHGVPLDYSDDNPDTMPKPEKIARRAQAHQ